MLDFITWEADLGGAEEAEIYSPAINGRLLRLRVTVTGPGFSEGSLALFSNGKPLGNFVDGFTGCDVFLRVPLQTSPLDDANVEYSDGYPAVEAPVLWGSLQASVTTNSTPGTTWRFEAIVER